MGFSVPPRLLLERWALTPPFHPYRQPKPAAVLFSVALSVERSFNLSPEYIPCPKAKVTRHRALRSSDFPPPFHRSRTEAILRPSKITNIISFAGSEGKPRFDGIERA